MTEVYFKTENRFIIALAWGPRRVTSRRRYGNVDSAYPSSVGAGASTWWRWILQSSIRWLKWNVRVVIPASRATARIATAIAGIDRESPVLEKSEIDVLLRRRLDLREKRDFAAADKIRGQLTDAGVNVRDQHAK